MLWLVKVFITPWNSPIIVGDGKRGSVVQRACGDRAGTQSNCTKPGCAGLMPVLPNATADWEEREVWRGHGHVHWWAADPQQHRIGGHNPHRGGVKIGLLLFWPQDWRLLYKWLKLCLCAVIWIIIPLPTNLFSVREGLSEFNPQWFSLLSTQHPFH